MGTLIGYYDQDASDRDININSKHPIILFKCNLNMMSVLKSNKKKLKSI